MKNAEDVGTVGGGLSLASSFAYLGSSSRVFVDPTPRPTSRGVTAWSALVAEMLDLHACLAVEGVLHDAQGRPRSSGGSS